MELNEKIAITPEIQGLINKLPEEVTTSGEAVNLQSMVTTALNEIGGSNTAKLGDAFEAIRKECPDMATEGIVISIFLRTFPKWDRFSGAEKTLQNVYGQLGCKSIDNPFNDFLTKYFNHGRGTGGLTDKNIAMLFNLLAKDIIEDNDISGNGPDGVNDLIYNPNVYSLSTDDGEFIITSYKWLSDPYNLKQMNIQAIMDDKSLPSRMGEFIFQSTEEGYGATLDKNKETLTADQIMSLMKMSVNGNYVLRTAIIFSNPSIDRSMYDMSLNKRSVVERALRDASKAKQRDLYAGEGPNPTPSAKNTLKRIMNDINALPADDRKALITALSREGE